MKHKHLMVYFIKVVDPDFTVSGGEYKRKVMYFKMGNCQYGKAVKRQQHWCVGS